MGKSKKGKTAAAEKVAKCTCTHPFECECGNRPERPTRGHKWDPEAQAWGGKGHKQKGGSGQTSQVAEAAKTTKVGGTQIAQWQSLPSTLIKDHCKREKRRPPKMKNISKTGGSYLCRLILPDSKDPDKDLFFVPQKGVNNEEQANEEACILALLSLTPTLPHERKLPEPYKTTWLHAIENVKAQKKKDFQSNKLAAKKFNETNANNNSNNNNTNTNTQNKVYGGGGGTAQASTSLTLGKTYTSKVGRQQQIDEKKRERNKRIRKHEAIRTANKNHPVFLAASLRQHIQNLLRGDDAELLSLLQNDNGDGTDMDGDGDSEEPQDADLHDGEVYVLERLRHEGFTKRQVITALQSIDKDTNKSSEYYMNEEKWDALYEECLQWLCIHLNEDQLPEGFDPRGGTLDIIAPDKDMNGTSNQSMDPSSSTAAASGGDGVNGEQVVTKVASDFASKYGITVKEAGLVVKQATATNWQPESILWDVLQKAAATSPESSASEAAAETSEDNEEALNEEIEALEAIFPAEFQHKKEGNLTVLTIKVTDVDTQMTLQAIVDTGLYPMAYPKRLLLQGKWPKGSQFGAAVHVEILKFMSTLDLGNPMMFEIYGEVQTIFHSLSSGDVKSLSLLPALGVAEVLPSANLNNSRSQPAPKAEATQQPTKQKEKATSSAPRKPVRRPRARSTFWSSHPSRTPSATAYPKIDNAMDRARKSLPAFKFRKEFLAAMSKADKGGRVVLVTGDTGCGKTTQIPQFILEEAPKDTKIVVAQPRRLAATGVATRVANERGEAQAGKESVGYVVRGDSAVCNSTRLLFCTTGVLLRQLQSEGALENISHIIIDEVHERHLDADVLLGFLKMTLKDYPNLRVVLMSATLDADKFAGYWGKNTPRIHIPGRTFPVEDYMLEDVLSLTGYIPPKNKKKKKWGGHQKPRKANAWADSERSDDEEDEDEEASRKEKGAGGPINTIPIEDLVKRVDETDLDYDLLAQLVCSLVRKKGPADDGSILVFLSGAPEINKAMETVKKVGYNLSLLVLPLHGGLQPKDQRLVFQSPRYGLTKVILSTNVAETSITIPDCTIVIDSCREKESSFDPANRMPLLLEQFASQASLKQRRGRAGRVRKGVCYKLISKNTYDQLPAHGEPEIQRCALDQTLLSLLFLGVERGSGTFMKKLLDPPSQESVDSAFDYLRDLGAVAPGDAEGETVLTPLGMHLAGIPAPPSVGKLLVMGSILGCRKAALAMAAGMSGRSPFLRIDAPRNNWRGNSEDEKTSIQDMKNESILDERKALLKKVGNSDHSLVAAAFMQWENSSTGGGQRKRVCDTLGLSFNGMRDMLALVNQYDSSLRSAGYAASKEADRNKNSWTIIRTCAVAALAPSQLVRVHRPSAKYAETVEGAVEKAGVAKELKFFIRTNDDEEQLQTAQAGRMQDERVFIHPSSFNFSVGSYYCPWLVYHSMVRTSKPFLRDVSECSAYSLLLFGGDLEVQANDGTVSINKWVKFDAKARIGSLIGGLRQRVDSLLKRKIDDPQFDLAGTTEMMLIVRLLVSDGHG